MLPLLSLGNLNQCQYGVYQQCSLSFSQTCPRGTWKMFEIIMQIADQILSREAITYNDYEKGLIKKWRKNKREKYTSFHKICHKKKKVSYHLNQDTVNLCNWQNNGMFSTITSIKSRISSYKLKPSDCIETPVFWNQHLIINLFVLDVSITYRKFSRKEQKKN